MLDRICSVAPYANCLTELQGVMNDPSLGPGLYYHYVETRIGIADGQKQFGVNKLDFSSGWSVV